MTKSINMLTFEVVVCNKRTFMRRVPFLRRTWAKNTTSEVKYGYMGLSRDHFRFRGAERNNDQVEVTP